MKLAHKKSTTGKILVIILNIILIACVIESVISAFTDAREISFSQNIENVRTLTDASANKVELVMVNQTYEIDSISNYINGYKGIGMTYEELSCYFDEFFSSHDKSFKSWQVVDNKINDEIGSDKAFNAVALGNNDLTTFCYHIQNYPELAQIYCKASYETIGETHYTSEFTDPSPMLAKSFAITSTIRVRTNDGYEYKTLMLLIKSDYMNALISNNNNVDTFNFFDYSNIIIDNSGNYVISDSHFQATNIFDYIKLYNSKLMEEEIKELSNLLLTEDYSDVWYYKNNRGIDCAYTIVPVQNSEWHILSIVPLNAFHNAYNFKLRFTKFTLFFSFLFLIDIVFVLNLNHKLRSKTKEAQSANIAKSQFLSSMSHDIRTPMNAIIGMTIIADDNLKELKPDMEVLKDCIQTIQLSGNHLLTLINDILDISKIENGKIRIMSDNFSITESMNKMFEISQSQIKEKNLKVETQIINIKHEFVRSDELRINQIYINILSNAIKYTNAGGKIIVVLTEETIENCTDKARYIYRVSDNGIGMTSEFIQTIFDRFSRAVDTRVNTSQGTGLGMAITKQLVDLFGGAITVESTLNVGSTFTVTLDLPIAEKKEQPIAIETQSEFDLKVLVAEDNQVNWKIISKILMRYGICAERAENGQQAFDMIVLHQYDMILMDIQMPVMNGYEATQAIRKLSDAKKANIPIYAMTADTFAEDVAKCKEKGMNGHLSKPIEVDKLVKVLSYVNEQKSK